MAIEEEEEAGIPEWVVTFGDLMSLLLTFFIMLVSMSEIKQQEKFQAMMESMRRQFGHDRSAASLAPGDLLPRNSRMESIASMGRAKRANTMRGGNKVKAPVGDELLVRTIRSGDRVTVGSVIHFDLFDSRLTDEAKRRLQTAATQIGGKPQKIEIRGHTLRRPPPAGSKYSDNWRLSFDRCEQTRNFLVDELGINPRRIRLNQAGDNEPVYLGIDPEEIKKNARVEVMIINERVKDLEGTPEQRKLFETEQDSETD